MPTVPDPLYISSRLMAALKIEGVGTIHLEATGYSSDGRTTYRHVIEDANGNVLDDSEDSIRSGVGDEPDYLGAMRSLLGFLSHEAGRYWRMDLRDPEWLFNAEVADWAHQFDDEIAIAEAELEVFAPMTPNTNHERDALANAMCRHSMTSDWFEKADEVLSSLAIERLFLCHADRQAMESEGEEE